MIRTAVIADDTAYMRMSLRKVLEKQNIKVLGEAKCGQEAFQLYKDLHPDMITMDIVMPNMDGLKAVEKIVDYDYRANVIMVSAMGQKSMVIRALNLGAKDFLVKPFHTSRIEETIARLHGPLALSAP